MKTEIITMDGIQNWISMKYETACIFKKVDSTTSIKTLIDGCQGVIDFISSCHPDWRNDLLSWWHEKMLPKFKKLEKNA